MSKKFQCTNFGNCRDADNNTIFEEAKVEEIDGLYCCPTCHQKLEEVNSGKSIDGKKIGIIAGAVALLGALVFGIIMLLNREPSEKTPPVKEEVPVVVEPEPKSEPETLVVEKHDTVKVVDTVVVEKTVKQNPAPKPSGPKVTQLSYGSFKGQLKNGQPHDANGTMTYTVRHLIDSRDPQKRYAEPGDYVIGEFSEGKLVQGVWYDKSNTVKGSIIIGK